MLIYPSKVQYEEFDCVSWNICRLWDHNYYALMLCGCPVTLSLHPQLKNINLLCGPTVWITGTKNIFMVLTIIPSLLS